MKIRAKAFLSINADRIGIFWVCVFFLMNLCLLEYGKLCFIGGKLVNKD